MILILLTNKNVALIYSLASCKQKTLKRSVHHQAASKISCSLQSRLSFFFSKEVATQRYTGSPPLSWNHYRELKQRRRRRQRERQKSNSFRLAKQQLCTCITLFCTFLCSHCTTTTWKCLISRFVKDVDTRQWLSFSFPELWKMFWRIQIWEKLPTFDESEVE